MTRRRTLLRTCLARQDLIDIWDHVVADNLAAADALLNRIDDACLGLLEPPRLGPARDDIRPGLIYRVPIRLRQTPTTYSVAAHVLFTAAILAIAGPYEHKRAFRFGNPARRQ